MINFLEKVRPSKRATIFSLFITVLIIVAAQEAIGRYDISTFIAIIRIIQGAAAIRFIVALYHILNEPKIPQVKMSEFKAMNTVTDGEVQVFKYVKDSVKEKYALRLASQHLHAMSLPPSDTKLSKLENVYFEPQDVVLDNRNWMIDVMGDPDDYNLFHQKNNGQKFLVYHLDTGVDKSHPDLNKAVLFSSSFTGEPVGDRNNHGTFSSSMYGSTNENHSPFPFKVAAGEIVISDMSVLADNGSGDFNWIIAGIEAATKDAPKRQKEGYITLMNMSLGADIETPSNLSETLKKARESGIIILAATGNSSLSRIGTPANDDSVLAITATAPDFTKANFANYGKGTDFAEGGVMCYGATLDGKSGFNNGTSFSCPWAINNFIAAASLYKFKDSDSLIEYVKSISQDLGVPGYDETFGWGYGLLKKMITTPPLNYEPTPPVVPRKRYHSFKSTKGFEISWKENTAKPRVAYNTIFIEEIDIKYEGGVRLKDAEKLVMSALDESFGKLKYAVKPDLDYSEVTRLIFEYTEKKWLEDGLEIYITYAVIDDNRSDTLHLEIEKAAKSVNLFKKKTLFDVDGNTLIAAKI